jgi:hypothetical protein
MPKNKGTLNATTELRVRQRVSIVHNEVAPEARSARYLGDERPSAGVSHLFGTLTGVGARNHDGSRLGLDSPIENDPRVRRLSILPVNRVTRFTLRDGCAGRARTLSHKSVGGT